MTGPKPFTAGLLLSTHVAFTILLSTTYTMARHHVSNTIPVAGVVACVLSAVLCAALLMQSATTSTSTSQGHAHEIPRQLRGVEPFGNTSFATFSYSNLATATACSHLYTLLPGEDCNSLGPLWTTTAATTTTAAAPAASTTQQHRRTATTTTSNPIIVFDAASLLMTIALNSVYIFAAIFKRNTVRRHNHGGVGADA